MINLFYEIILWGYIPLLLFLVIIMKKHEKKDLQLYWGYKIQEKSSLKSGINTSFLTWCISIGVILILSVVVLFLCELKIFNIAAIIKFFRGNKGQEIVVTDLAAISAFSLVFALKKRFYLGINIQDVLENSFLPDILQYIWIDSIILIIDSVLGQTKLITDEAEIVLSIIFVITYLLWICHLLYLFWNITKLLISTTKSELKSFDVLKYRINSCYVLENKNAVDKTQLNAVSEYLFKKIQRKYGKFAGKQNELCDVKLKSVELDKNIWIDISGTLSIGVIALLFDGIGWGIQLSGKSKIPRWGAMSATAITGVALGIGCFSHIWARGTQDRTFYEFQFGTKKKIVMKGCNPIWNRRYKFIGYVEDLLGLYKILLENDVQEGIRNTVVESMYDYIESETLKNVIGILLLYLEYENNLKVKKKKIHKKKIKNRYNKEIRRDSIEYNLSNSILCEVYKQNKIENGSKNYQELENVIFDSMVDYINDCIN